jgi:hypothetical protein
VKVAVLTFGQALDTIQFNVTLDPSAAAFVSVSAYVPSLNMTATTSSPQPVAENVTEIASSANQTSGNTSTNITSVSGSSTLASFGTDLQVLQR